MKKVLSLALVLCMAIACFAFAPTSAEIYWGNLLTTTEENDTAITNNVPWGMEKFGFSAWLYGDKDGQQRDCYFPEAGTYTFTSDEAAIIPGEGRYGEVKAVKIDMTKLWLHGNGVHNDHTLQFTAPGSLIEAGKTYTFFFMAKSNAAEKITFMPLSLEGNNQGCENIAMTVTSTSGTLGADWSVIKATFTTAEQTGGTKNPQLGNTVAFRIDTYLTAEAAEGDVIYLDGFAMVEGDGSDIDATYYDNYKDPLDIDGDKLYPDADFDVDGDEIPNQYDNDIDADSVKNVWDRDIDGDGIANGADDNPFGLVVPLVVIG